MQQERQAAAPTGLESLYFRLFDGESRWGIFGTNMGSVSTSLAILEAVAREPRRTLAELVEELALPKTTVHRNLLALSDAGWIRQEREGRERLWTTTVKLLVLSRLADHIPDLRASALPVMESVRKETAETTHLVVLEDSHCVLIERLDSPQPLRTVQPLGGRVPIHASSTGKAMLAHFSADELERYLARTLEAVTTRTITDPVALRRELATVRKRRHAINDREMNDDVRAVGAAILNAHGEPIAGISVSGPVYRMQKDKLGRYGEIIATAAGEISSSLFGE